MKNKIPWPITARTRRIELRPYAPADYEAWLVGYTQRKPKQHKYDAGPIDPRKCTRAIFRKLIARHTRFARVDKVYVFGIFERRTGRHLGTIDISTISRDWYQWANLGYVVHNTAQGQGYGKEAARAGIQLAFAKLGYKRVEASINLDNRRSMGLARSLGMKCEGVRKEYIYENRKWIDHRIYSALNPRRCKEAYPLL